MFKVNNKDTRTTPLAAVLEMEVELAFTDIGTMIPSCLTPVALSESLTVEIAISVCCGRDPPFDKLDISSD